jgi:hypothetical protein
MCKPEMILGLPSPFSLGTPPANMCLFSVHLLLSGISFWELEEGFEVLLRDMHVRLGFSAGKTENQSSSFNTT